MNKNFKSIIKLFLCQASALMLLANCSTVTDTSSPKGMIRMAIKFPEKSFSVKSIPTNTSSINVSVTGINLSSPINFSLTKEKNSQIFYVEQGDALVKASAVDKDGKELAKGEQKINVKPYISNKVVISLDEPSTGSSSSPDNSGNPSIPSNGGGNIQPTPNVIPSNSSSGGGVSTSPTPVPSVTPVPSPTPTRRPGSGSGGSNPSPNSNENIDVDVSIDDT